MSGLFASIFNRTRTSVAGSMEGNIWVGSVESLKAYHTLAERCASADPATLQARCGEVEEPDALALHLNVDHDRIGLGLIDAQGDLAILNIAGSTVNAYKWWHPYYAGEVVSYDAIKDAAAILASASAIKNVVVLGSSHGGMVVGVESAARALSDLAKVKNTVAHSETVAMSAGYWLLSSLPVLTGSAMAEFGSIGTLAIYTDYSKAAAEFGYKYHVIKAGREKDYGFGGTEFTKEELDTLQARVDTANSFFLAHVAKSRKLSLSDTNIWAEAQTFFAKDALAVGLIDRITTLAEVVGSLAPTTPNIGGTAMTISEEKMALITAGAAPESVLTAEELKEYQEAVASQTVAETPAAENEEAEVAQEEPPVEAKAPDATADLAKQVGRLEAKLEAKDAALTDLQAKLDAALADVAQLKPVAQAAVSNLQVALRVSKEAKDSVADIVAQYQGLHSNLQKLVPVGRVSDASHETRESKVSQGVPDPIRPGIKTNRKRGN